MIPAGLVTVLANTTDEKLFADGRHFPSTITSLTTKCSLASITIHTTFSLVTSVVSIANVERFMSVLGLTGNIAVLSFTYQDVL